MSYTSVPCKGTKQAAFCLFYWLVFLLPTSTIMAEEVLADGKETSDVYQPKLAFEQVISWAIEYDPWMVESFHQQQALEYQADVENHYDNLRLSLDLKNIATDSYDFSQENMTHFSIGASQKLPRGNSLVIRRKQKMLMANLSEFERSDRQRLLRVSVGSLWLNLYKTQQTVKYINENRSLLEQLVDVAEANYSSTIGRTRQQDLIAAQLELTRLDDRLAKVLQYQHHVKSELAGWISPVFLQQYAIDRTEHLPNQPALVDDWKVLAKLPSLVVNLPPQHLNNDPLLTEKITKILLSHPAIKGLEQQVKVSQESIELAKQQDNIEWTLRANYGYRDNTLDSQGRSDLLSVGVTFDLPFLNDSRQKQLEGAAVSTSLAHKTKKWQKLREMLYRFKVSRAHLAGLNDRERLYLNKLLPKLHEQSEASLTAYTNDDGRFTEVIRANIAELDAKIEAINIAVEIRQTVLEVNYFLEPKAAVNKASDSIVNQSKIENSSLEEL